MRTNRETHALRFAITTSFVFVIGMLIDWESAYLAAVFTSILLEKDEPLPISSGIVLLIATSCIYLFIFVVFTFLLHYPALFFMAVIGLLAVIFFMSVAGKSPLIVTMSLFAALIIPYVSTSSTVAAWTQTVWLPVNMGIAIVATWCAYVVFPARATKQRSTSDLKYNKGLTHKQRFAQMMLSSVPFVVFFLFIGGSHLLTLLYVGLFCTQLATPAGKGSVSPFEKLIANLVGALVVLIAYEILVIAPMIITMVLVILVISLCFGWWLTSDFENAKLARSGLTGVIILLGDAMSPLGDSIEVSVVERIIEISAAVIIATVLFEMTRLIIEPSRLSNGEG